jgi:hypothetical protein
MESLTAGDVEEPAEEERVLEVPDEETFDQLRASLSNSKGDKPRGKKGFGNLVSSLFAGDED